VHVDTNGKSGPPHKPYLASQHISFRNFEQEKAPSIRRHARVAEPGGLKLPDG
jgi:hypothetical protein